MFFTTNRVRIWRRNLYLRRFFANVVYSRIAQCVNIAA